MLAHIPGLGPAVRHHHERFDGRGYPDGLSGEDIPLVARVVSVADAFDAMVRSLPYARGISQEDALEEIDRNSGTQFDPVLFKEGCYRLCPRVRVSSDVGEFDVHCERGRRLEGAGRKEEAAEYEEAVALYSGDYLAEDLYEDWTMIERERLTNAYVVDAPDRLADHHAEVGRLREAIRRCNRMLEKDPCHERTHRRLIPRRTRNTVPRFRRRVGNSYRFRRPVFGSGRAAVDSISNRTGPDGSCLVRRSYNLSEEGLLRGMAERTNALVLKTSGDNTPVGSNPTAPARRKPEDVTSSVDQRKQETTDAPISTALARSKKAIAPRLSQPVKSLATDAQRRQMGPKIPD